MKKALYYTMLAVSFALLLPYIIVAILVEYYYRLVILLIKKPTSYVRDWGKFPNWINAILAYVDKLQDYEG